MKINFEDGMIPFSDLTVGNVFTYPEYEGSYWMKIETDWKNGVTNNAVNLCNGITTSFGPSDEVILVRYTFTVAK